MKKLLKKFDKFIKNFWVQLVVLVGISVAILALGGAFASGDTVKDKILEIVTGTDFLGIFLAAAISLIVAKVLIRVKDTLEESLKLEDDHHKIISRYSEYKAPDALPDKTRFSENGELMVIGCVPDKRRPPHSMVADPYSEENKLRETDIADYYERDRLRISGVDIFANVEGNADIVFRDTDVMRELPDFIRDNAAVLLGAHSGSAINNSVTVRLKDIGYDEDRKTLVLDTERSQYFYMLVTNRCMDFKIADAITVREVYEFGKQVSPLRDSKLGNQIGINGLVFTSDGYLLIEKRGKKKTTWKDKFAQPISLALKQKDFLPDGGSLEDTPKAANDAFRRIIFKTLLKNYGIDETMIAGIGADGSVEKGAFDLKDNFLGIARDLIEGGKPNMYFYVLLNKTASELKDIMQERARAAAKIIEKDKKKCARTEQADSECTDEKLLPAITAGKLDRALYLVRTEDIAVDFGYSAKLDPRRIMRVKFRYHPRVNRVKEALDGAGYKLRRAMGIPLKKECGEALLTCLYYAEACRGRINGRMQRLKENDR